MKSCIKHQLQFIKPAKTSKIDYLDKHIVLISAAFEDQVIQGECAPLVHLSKEKIEECIAILNEMDRFPKNKKETTELTASFPSSLKFAFEGMQLERELHGKPLHKEPIKINGLIWMNGFDLMWDELVKKVEAGFDCIKVKIGQHDFDAECRFLEKVRKHYAKKIELRLDANGAFHLDDAIHKLKDLSRFGIHSIEQPIQPGQWDAMEMVCKESEIAIGLDEELIDIKADQQAKLMRKIKPQFIILKPTLHGGFAHCDQWIHHAQRNNTEWWATSSLESNIGLYHIALWLSKYKLSLPQGLGTGSLFKENFDRPFYYEKDQFCWKN